ncbi:MAG TPA: hypothetical protein VEY50_10145 [Lysobacter sp.]|nr:hypothetical protein [Lysobacter sp.]
MKTTTRLLLIACLSLPVLVACKKEDEAAKPVEKAPLTAPADANDENAWGEYLKDVITRRVEAEGLNTSPYVYFLPAETKPTFEDEYNRLLEKATADASRGITEGNMLAFGSPSSAKMADLVVAAFAKAQPGSMKGVKFVFIGKAEDSERVKAAVAPTGVDYTFVEAK